MADESSAVMVPMDVQWQPAWLTWVAATTSCLRALGHDCDTADVAGMTGYAFITSVHKELCPSGPTVFDWYSLLQGVQCLGRATLNFTSGDCHCEGFACDRTRTHCHAAYDLVAREIEAGRPCVIWGAYVPEFAAAIGVEDGCFLVKSFRQCTGEPEPPIPCEALDAPGGPYALGFPTRTAVPQQQADIWAIQQAAQITNSPRMVHHYSYGVEAYDAWIAALEAGLAAGFGNAYNSQCWAEARRFAHEFLRRVAARNEFLAPALEAAVSASGDATAAMDRIAELFPFPGGDEVKSPATCAEAIEALRQARDAEARVAASLKEAALLPKP